MAEALKKEKVLSILQDSFDSNPSVNFVVKQDTKRSRRLRLLMEYSYFYCTYFGKIYLSEEQNCCALIIEPHQKRTTVRTLLWDLKLALGCIGIGNIKHVLKRESVIKQHHPKEPFIHFWYLGVEPAEQGKGLGSAMIKKVLVDAVSQNKTVYLETSNPKNFPLYEKMGFEMLADLGNSGYGLRVYRKGKQ